jgi:hypothetical protein
VLDALKWYEMHQNVSLGPNGVDHVSSLRKIPTRLRGTKFCTRSARFAPNSVRQPNGPKCSQIIRNIQKHQFRVQWGGSGVFLAKKSDVTSWHELLHYFGSFCAEFRKATKRTQMHPNSMKRTKIFSLGSNGVDWVHSLRKIPSRLRVKNFCTSSACFAPSSVRQPNGPKCTQIVRNSPKRQFRVQWGGSCAFVAKNSYATSCHEVLH